MKQQQRTEYNRHSPIQQQQQLHTMQQLHCMTVYLLWAAGNLILSLNQNCDRTVVHCYAVQLSLLLVMDRLLLVLHYIGAQNGTRWVLLLFVGHAVALIAASTLYKLATIGAAAAAGGGQRTTETEQQQQQQQPIITVTFTSDDVCTALNPFVFSKI